MAWLVLLLVLVFNDCNATCNRATVYSTEEEMEWFWRHVSIDDDKHFVCWDNNSVRISENDIHEDDESGSFSPSYGFSCPNHNVVWQSFNACVAWRKNSSRTTVSSWSPTATFACNCVISWSFIVVVVVVVPIELSKRWKCFDTYSLYPLHRVFRFRVVLVSCNFIVLRKIRISNLGILKRYRYSLQSSVSF